MSRDTRNALGVVFAEAFDIEMEGSGAHTDDGEPRFTFPRPKLGEEDEEE